MLVTLKGLNTLLRIDDDDGDDDDDDDNNDKSPVGL